MTRYLGRNEILNTKHIEFNSVVISVLWHEPPMLCRGQINVAGMHTTAVGNVKLSLSENMALLLHTHVDVPCSLVVTQHDFGWQIVSP